ncbi:hypothetical protein CVT25_002237 [Psilocybe cyanescens]|uniref:Translocon Sec61/SecY plug domain-containing protein n=1 Tax=Psilocybe cyanescens TaxID=93625 RepID=A0A409X5L9_PSICY|nr:hypothetical protein CVT25_002237 [Psilocybe cyanescens]
MIMQLLAGANLIDVDFRLKEDRALFSGAQQSTVYMLTGLYGEPSALGAGTCLLIIIQPIVAVLIVIIVDELLQKGYGLGSGINLFIATNIWSNVFIVAQMLATRFPQNWLVKILGVCEHLKDCPQLSATCGIAYCMSRPHTTKEPILDPIHTTIYIVFMLSACTLFSKTSIEISGSGPRDVAKQLKDGQVNFVYLCTMDGTLTNGVCDRYLSVTFCCRWEVHMKL